MDKRFFSKKKLKTIVKKLLKTDFFKLRQAEYFAKPKKKVCQHQIIKIIFLELK